MVKYLNKKLISRAVTAAIILLMGSALLLARKQYVRFTLMEMGMDVMTGVDDGIARHGALRVEGHRLLDKSGTPLQLRGMSSHGLTWYPEYVNARALRSIKERGANVFRAAMYADSVSGGYNYSVKDKRFNTAMLYIAVENALDMDMYVIADWHLLQDKNPLLCADEAVDFFAELSSRYPNEPGILYEICNEPNGETTWADIKTYADRVIPVIRKNSPDAVIIVGTPNYSTDIDWAVGDPLHYSNIMYTYHLYTGVSKGHYAKAVSNAMESDIAIFVTEWGISRDPKTGALDTDEAYEFIAFMRKHKISWVNWSLSNKAEDHASIKETSKKLSGWDSADLTISGKIIFKALKG